MDIVCIVGMGLIALAALIVLWRTTQQSDPALVRSMCQTVINAFNAGLASSVKEKQAQVKIAELDIHQMFQTPDEPSPPGRVDGEVGLDDGRPEESP